MKRVLPLLCLFVGSACVAQGSTTTTLYKSTGPDGRTVYSDRPPTQGPAAQTFTIKNLPATPLSAATLAYIEELKKSSSARAAQLPPSGDTVLFSAVWCGYCKQAKAFLASKGAPYREVDIDTKEGAAAFVRAGGKGGVPLLVANGKSVAGFSAAAYEALLQAPPR